MAKPKKPSLELIQRYRGQDFRRAIIEHVPSTLQEDEVTLACGHKTTISASLLKAMETMAEPRCTCYTCEKEWLAKAERKGL